MKKKVIIGVVIVAVLAAGGYKIVKSRSSKELAYTGVPVTRKDIRDVVSSAGTINAIREIEVKSKASGEILKIHIKEGDYVRKGQLLLELDKTDELSNVRQRRAELMAAEARVIQAEERLKSAVRNYEQQRTLVAEKLSTQEHLLQAESSRKTAQADLAIQQASLITAQEQLRSEELRYADTEIRAPIDGVVLQQLVEEGQIIASGISSNSGGTLIFLLGDLSRIIAKAEIDEVDISRAHLGQRVDVLVDAYENKRFEGVLTHIAPQAVNQSNVTVFNIEVEVTDGDKAMLKPGMTATAEIVISQKKDVITVPSHAIISRRGKTFVLAGNEKAPVRVPVVRGIESDEDTEIIKGLEKYSTVYIREQSGQQNDGGRQGANGNRSNQRRMMGMMRMGR